MNEKIIRPGVIKRVVDLLKCRNKKYTQEDVDNIITAFWDVIIEAIINGDSINLKVMCRLRINIYQAVRQEMQLKMLK